MSEAVVGEKRIGEKKAVNKLPAFGDNMSSTIECREKVITKIGMLSETDIPQVTIHFS